MHKLKIKWKGLFWRLEYNNGKYELAERKWAMILFGTILTPIYFLQWIFKGITSSTDVYCRKIGADETKDKKKLKRLKFKLLN